MCQAGGQTAGVAPWLKARASSWRPRGVKRRGPTNARGGYARSMSPARARRRGAEAPSAWRRGGNADNEKAAGEPSGVARAADHAQGPGRARARQEGGAAEMVLARPGRARTRPKRWRGANDPRGEILTATAMPLRLLRGCPWRNRRWGKRRGPHHYRARRGRRESDGPAAAPKAHTGLRGAHCSWGRKDGRKMEPTG